jgi:hypothetical protein
VKIDYDQKLQRLRHRAISTLELLSEDEVEAGLRAMERAASSAEPASVGDVGDLLILRNARQERIAEEPTGARPPEPADHAIAGATGPLPFSGHG